MTFHNVVILIKSVWNENKNNYYYNIFLEKDKRQKKAWERYQNLIEEGKRHNKNPSKVQKQNLVEYRKNYYLTHKK